MDLCKEKIIRACILTIPGIGSQRLRHLIARYGSAQAAWDSPDFTLVDINPWLKDFLQARKRISPEKIESNLTKEGISLVAREEDSYPFLLAECPGAPPLLFYKGKLEPKRECIAMVGARKATPYGKAAASFLAKEMALEDFVVVSGLARGIDAAAHKGTLEADGTTWAFLAGGLDKIYPPENLKLALEIMEKGKGAIISEYPPGMCSEPGQFPARNRLISGSSRGVIVVEAAEKSGALITVDFALEQGREVFAVPGPIFSEMSRGTHQLLKMGAKLVETKEDIIAELSVMDKPEISNAGRNQKRVIPVSSASTADNKCEEEIMQFLSDTPLHIDRLTSLCTFSPQEVALSLLEMQLSGRLVQLPGQHYVLQR
ncbi:MAG: DNA protecting protein DprA [Gracilibacter sp. BRH_c7a]|nr:MAG: DNA protecting protein DprA [Gracilibacter sp. BRH_c7a]